jgi:hypothetical protein
VVTKGVAQRRSGQISVPLTQEEENVLHALAFLARSSRAEVIAPVVRDFLAEDGRRDKVRMAVEVLRDEAASECSVTPCGGSAGASCAERSQVRLESSRGVDPVQNRRAPTYSS